jgi:hypothetical protein
MKKRKQRNQRRRPKGTIGTGLDKTGVCLGIVISIQRGFILRSGFGYML